ncbi:zinc finger MYM-type protein 1-like [Capsicum annuum]|uniref:zinc finger MYM-type protein 1-like n=1 Tax=Capsicum annuum TaxID=4072 RepID=UPI001FB0B69B|nr:zinc finger MYM-type protein 1-like [Capsicum annuum]
MMLDLDNQGQSILASFNKQSEKTKDEYRVCLNASIDVARYHLKEGLPFRGHDESETSTRKGNFLDLLKWYADRKEDVKKVVLENAPQNDIMICPNVQKDIVNSCAKEILKAIVEDLNGDYFGILVEDSKDVSHKEQMALVLQYVNKEGKLIERYLGIVHVKDTSAWSLKDVICSLLLEHNLSSSRIRGQGYDRASNMQGEFNAVAKKHHEVDQFFNILTNVLNVVGGSFKHREMLRNDQTEKLEELLILEVLAKEGSNYQEKSLAKILVDDIRSYEFVYTLHLMLKVLAITHDLNVALQRKDQDIVTAMNLFGFTKRRLQSMRDSKWDSLVKDVSLFCSKHDIMISEMNKNYALGKSKRKISGITYSHHLCVEIFHVVIDLQLGELNSRFDEVNTDLLLGMASLSPDNSFVNYDKNRIIKLATYYPDEFSAFMLEDLSFELDNHIDYVRQGNNDLSKLKKLGDISETLVKTNLHNTWRLVY